jgi:PKD repeat protein
MFCVIREENMEGKTLTVIGLSVLLVLSVFSGCVDNNALPVVSISTSQVTGYEPLNVSFTLDVDSNRPIQSYYWNFGDGFTSVEQNPTHVFEEDGSYAVQVMVTDDNGKIVTEITYISVMKSIELNIKGIYGRAENNKMAKMEIYVEPVIEAGKTYNRNLSNITIEINVLDEHVSLDYKGAILYLEGSNDNRFDPILYDIGDSEFGLLVIQDSDGSCTQGSPVVNYDDRVYLTVNLSVCFEGVPPRTFVNGTVGNIDGIIDGIINFCTPLDIGTGATLQ